MYWREPRPSGETRAVLARMMSQLHHRGPDGDGIVTASNGRCGIGNTRLAIRDLSPAGALPFVNESGDLAVAYNGEVYNAAELKQELLRLGQVFRSENDAEVVLRGYAVWGPDVVSKLRGMFAFVVLEQLANRSRLFFARDPLGIKPLYYGMAADAIVIASELKAIRASGLIPREVEPTALHAYLRLGSVPAPWTIDRSVWALEPARSVVLDRFAAPAPCTYWQFPTSSEPVSAEADAPERTGFALRDAVRSHLVSDVPIGAFLSGGLDSSLVVALMSEVLSTPVRTCSLAFEDQRFDESTYSRAVARRFNTQHYERVLTAHDVLSELPKVFRALEQPTIDGVNTYFVSAVAREAGLTVALSGLGGDELFGGYEPTFRDVPRMLRLGRVAERVPGGKGLARSAARLPRGQRWKKVQEALRGPITPAVAYVTMRSLFTEAEVGALLRSTEEGTFDCVEYVASRAGVPEPGPSANAEKAWVSATELRTYTLNQLLRDTDAASMAHSLEVRVPFLDTRLVESVMRLPAGARFEGTGPKPLLRRIAGPLLPEQILERRQRQGFFLPFDRWLRAGDLGDLLQWKGGVFDRFHPRALERARQDFQRGRLHWSRVWALSALQGWQEAA